jgi:hypothetical protein
MVVAAVLGYRERTSVVLFGRAYWQFLLQPWKVATFGVALLGITLMAPYTGDPTWDYFDAGFMAIFTFLSAPWAVGVFYKISRGALPLKQGYIALCLLLFSASWSYDLYLLLRDGKYPVTWLANLIASTLLYASAGLFWNLAWTPEKGQYFAFADANWPAMPHNNRFSKIALPAVLFMAVIGGVMLIFLLPIISSHLASK